MNENDPMADGVEGVELPEADFGEAGELTGEVGGGGNRLIFTIVAVVLLAFQAVSSHYAIKYFFFSEPPKPKPANEVGGETIGEIWAMEGMIVNPKESRGNSHLLIDIHFETNDSKVIEELGQLEPVIRDNVNTFLAAQRYEVLTDITMRDKIRQRVIDIVNYHLTKGQVRQAYFVRYVVQ